MVICLINRGGVYNVYSMFEAGINEVSVMRSMIKIGCLIAIVMTSSSLALSSVGEYSGVSTTGNLSVWRINHKNGAVSLCSFEGHINEPVCYPGSGASKGGNFSIVLGDDVLSTWRINGSTGSVSLCEYKAVTEPPICTPWSTK